MTALQHTVPAMQARGHEVTIVTRDLRGAYDRSVRVETVKAARRGGLAGLLRRAGSLLGAPAEREDGIARAFSALHDAKPVDIVESEESFGIPASIGRALPGVPVVARLHGPWREAVEALGTQPSEADRSRVADELAAIRGAQGLTAPSMGTMRPYLGETALSQVIFNPLPAPARADTSSVEAGTIVFVGRIDQRKGADVAIDAVAALIAEGLDVRLHLCGFETGIVTGAETLGFEEYLSRAVPEKYRDRFVYHGVQSPEQIAELRRRAAVILNPSRYETFGYTAAEAMVAGKAVVATDVDGLNELIEDGTNGLLVPPGDAKATAAALRDLLAKPDEAERLGKAAAAWAAVRLAPDVLAAETEAFYAKVMSEFEKTKAA
ncbi:glycosyltransferase [Parvularcula dongshanensis]|uniref:glycosyltransferase n=1 Tax=Parvularcula dongshanensis TaxID=1173995 RepID=UPI00161516C1